MATQEAGIENRHDAGQSIKPTEEFETIVIGGGQAGLAVGYYLKKRGRSFVILDANDRIGGSWRTRTWNSLRLFTPARYDGLPGWGYPGPGWSYPTAKELADATARYAAGEPYPAIAAALGAAAEAVAVAGLDAAGDTEIRDLELATAPLVLAIGSRPLREPLATIYGFARTLTRATAPWRCVSPMARCSGATRSIISSRERISRSSPGDHPRRARKFTSASACAGTIRSRPCARRHPASP